MKTIKTSTGNILEESNSLIAQQRDCSIRAFAFLFFKEDYEKAAAFLGEELQKAKDKGVKGAILLKWLRETEDFKQKQIIGMGDEYGDVHKLSQNINSRTKEPCKMTVGAFIKQFPKGTYCMTTSDHMFVIKDGEVYGNLEDGVKMMKRLETAWQIKWK